METMKWKVWDAGVYNDWRGFADLYFTNKEMSKIAKELKMKVKDAHDCTILELKFMYNL